MTMVFTKEDAMKELPFIEDKILFKGINLALWLYLDKDFNLKNSINIAAKKHSVKPKIAIERLLRMVIPEDIILERIGRSRPKSLSPTSKTL